MKTANDVSMNRYSQGTTRESINWRIRAAVHHDWRTKLRATAKSIWIDARQQAGAAR